MLFLIFFLINNRSLPSAFLSCMNVNSTIKWFQRELYEEHITMKVLSVSTVKTPSCCKPILHIGTVPGTLAVTRM